MKASALLRLRLSPTHYLWFQSIGSVVVNGGINAGVMLVQYRDVKTFRLFDAPSMAIDTFWSALLLSFLTCILGTWFVRNDMRSGRVDGARAAREAAAWVRFVPSGTLWRGLVFGVLFTLLTVPATLGAMSLLGAQELGYAHFFVLKVAFASILGVIVTPLNAARVISQAVGREA